MRVAKRQAPGNGWDDDAPRARHTGVNVDGRRRARWGIALVSAVCLLSPAAARAQTDRWQVGSYPSTSSGSYGTDSRTTVVYTPLTVRRLFDAGDVTAVLPFMCIHGNGAVTLVGDQPARTTVNTGATNAAANTPGPRPGNPSAVPPGRVDTSVSTTASALAEVTTSCGYGDIVLRGRYYAVDQRGAWPTIALRAHVKAPTASADRGLGTGRPDEGFGVEVTRDLGRGLAVMVDGGYTFIGKPDGVDFSNRWWYDVGISHRLTRNVSVTVFFEEYGAIVSGLADARDLLAVVNITGTTGWRIQAGGLFGLSDGSPDHGFTFGVSRRF